jgi:hypothetical protein
MTVFVETDFTDASFAELDQATMTAGITFQRARFEVFGQFGRTLSGHRIEDVGKWRGCTADWHC